MGGVQLLLKSPSSRVLFSSQLVDQHEDDIASQLSLARISGSVFS